MPKLLKLFADISRVGELGCGERGAQRGRTLFPFLKGSESHFSPNMEDSEVCCFPSD